MSRFDRNMGLVSLGWLVAAGITIGTGHCQTPRYPSALATDTDLLIAANNAHSTLAITISSGTTSITLVDGSRFSSSGAFTMEGEIIHYCAKAGAVFTVCASGRGFDGTAAAAHSAGVTVQGLNVAWHHNAVTAEVKAIETTLGINLANVALVSHTHPASDIVSGLLLRTRGATGTDMSLTGGAGHFVRQNSLNGALTTGLIQASDVPGTITINSLIQITDRRHSLLTEIGVNTHAQIDTHIAATTAHGSTALNTASTIVQRDASGNFAAGTITGALAGNATTSTALAADPADCTGNTFALGINASGVAQCAQPSFSNLSGSATLAQLPFGTANQLYKTNAGATAIEQATLSTGTSGTNFGVAFGVGTIVLNLPTASGTNRGALSSADWTTFNTKESALTFSTPLSRSVNTISVTTVPVTLGGTALASLTNHALLVGQATAAVAFVGPCAATNVVHGQGSSADPNCAQVNLASDVSGNLPVTNLDSGTGASATTFWRGDGTWVTPAGAGTVTSVALSMPGMLCTVSGSPVTGSGTLTCTAIGTSGGIPAFTSSSVMTSSAELVIHRVVVGGGAAGVPSTISSSGLSTTVLHGNAAGDPTFAAVNLGTDVSGNLPVTRLNSGTDASSSTFWRGDGVWSTPTPGGAAGGDLGGTYPNPDVLKVHGISYPATGALHTVPVVTTANSVVTYQTVPNDALTNSSVTITPSGGLGGGGAVALGDSLGIDALGRIANETITGTTTNRLVSLTGAPSKAIITTAGATAGVIGICESNCGTSGSAAISQFGSASCDFDGATTAGDYVGISASVNGKCTDSGATFPTIGQVLGRVLSTNGALGTYAIQIALELQGVTPGAHNLLSLNHGDTLTHVPALGDTIYGNPTPKWQALAGNTTSTKQFLSQTGTGAVSAAPTWDTIMLGDLPGSGAITVAGTANQVNVAGSPVSLGGTVTLSTPQNIHSAATPTFAALTLSNNTNELVLGTTNTTTITMASLTGSRIFTLPDAASNPVQPLTCGAGDFVSAIAGTGILTCTTPAAGGSGTVNGTGVTGDVPYYTAATAVSPPTSSAHFWDNTNLRLGVNVSTAPAAFFDLAGTQPASVGTSPGTAATSTMGLLGGTGGNTTLNTTAVGGIGGGATWTGGVGGTAASAATSSTGGAGGPFGFTGGVGGAATASGTTRVGGIGGALSLVGGLGGAGTGGTTNTGGKGGDLNLTGGAGGTGGTTGGAAGNIVLTPGGVGSGGSPTIGIVKMIYAAANSTSTKPILVLDNPSGGTQTAMDFRQNAVVKGSIQAGSTLFNLDTPSGVGIRLTMEGADTFTIFANGFQMLSSDFTNSLTLRGNLIDCNRANSVCGMNQVAVAGVVLDAVGTSLTGVIFRARQGTNGTAGHTGDLYQGTYLNAATVVYKIGPLGQPASVATATGTAESTAFSILGGGGGNTTITTTGTGGAAGDWSATLGNGGTANSANTSDTGGRGGDYGFTAGNGAAASATGTDVGGRGGTVTLTGGNGGNATVGSSTTGGAAGNITLAAGSAGTGTTANGATGFVQVSVGSLRHANSQNVASAATMLLTAGNLFHITGTTNIDTLNNCTSAENGRVVYLIFDDILTVGDANNLKLAGAFVTTASDTLSLACDGSNWYELGRSVN